jgi:hypothetical protein
MEQLSPDARLTLTLFVIGAVGTFLWWQIRRVVGKTEERWAKLDSLILTDAQDKIILPSMSLRMDRVEGAIAKMTELVATMGLQLARVEIMQELQHVQHARSAPPAAPPAARNPV